MIADLEKNQYLIFLSQFSKFGPRRLELLKNRFPSWKEAFNATEKDLLNSGLEQGLVREFCAFRKNFNNNFFLEKLSKADIKTAILGEKNYPELLDKISDPPPIIYYRGQIDFPQYTPLAVVGSRKYDSYGQKIVETIVAELAENNFLIISGLAIGIDALAHQQALNKKAPTIAVLGSGINRLYPPRNLSLAKRIIDSGGGIISEFPFDYPPLKSNFPLRNRIISGLSAGVLVVEARKASGSLITAYSALEQGREVFAVPGDIDRGNSQGTNELIKKGATPILRTDDVLEAFGLEKTIRPPLLMSNFSKNEKLILLCLSKKSHNIEELIILTKLDTKIINSTLSILEIKNIIKKTGNNYYLKNLLYEPDNR